LALKHKPILHRAMSLMVIVAICMAALCVPIMISPQDERPPHGTFEIGTKSELTEIIQTRSFLPNNMKLVLKVASLTIIYAVIISMFYRMIFPYYSNVILTSLKKCFLMPIMRTSSAYALRS